MYNFPWLSALVFLPLLTGILVLMVPRQNRRLPAVVGLLGGFVAFLLAIWVYKLVYGVYDLSNFGAVSNPLPPYELKDLTPWIPAVGAQYHLGVTGLSLGLTLLTTFLVPMLLVFLMNRLPENSHALVFTILALETAVLGVLLSMDVLLFYVFWEAMLIPMYFLIAIWGGPDRARASLKFIVYMMVGSLLMLVGILWFYWYLHSNVAGGPFTFSLVDWIALASQPQHHMPHWIQMWMFFFFFISFAIKVPLFPFHTWLPDAMAEGPTAFNVLLIEVGAYGFIRFCLPLFPDAAVTWAPVIMGLAVANVLYGAALAVVQQDLKRLFAYSTISHAGFIMLGIFSMTVQGMDGGVLYMINSGLTMAALYMVVEVLQRRRGSRLIKDFGGLAAAMPVFFFLFMVLALAAMGLPGLNGFPPEFLTLLGSIRSVVVSPGYGYAAGGGVVLSAVYMLWMFQRVMYGQRPPELENVPCLDADERLTLSVFAVVVIILGLGSAYLTRPMLPAVNSTLAAMEQGLLNTPDVSPVPERP